MANYFYNGVELPDINTVWTDKETYPYASIARVISSNEYRLYLSQIQPQFREGASDHYFNLPNPKKSYDYNNGTWELRSEDTYPNGGSALYSSIWSLVWTSFDVFHGDSGEFCFLTSEPKSVGNAIISIAHYRAACDAIRAKTGKAEPIKSGDMAAEIESIRAVGGESYEGNPYLTFSSANAFTIATGNSSKNWNGTLYYSTDTETWITWTGFSAIASAEHEGEQRIYMRGVNNARIGGTSSDSKWVLTGDSIACNGNIETLLDYEILLLGKHPAMGRYAFAYLFSGCTSLTSAPELSSTTLEYRCYYNMFNGCTSLTSAPELPTTTLAEYCYGYMFNGCTSLTSAPKLPATTLTKYCYYYMFQNCTNLTTIPALPATTLVMYCYQRMFSGCTSIKLSDTKSDDYPNEYRIPTEGTGKSASYALSYMFTNTGGTFTGAPTLDTTYYTANVVV